MNDTLRKLIRQEIEKATFKITAHDGKIGTGFFISPDGYVITAYHCIEDKLRPNETRFHLKFEFFSGEVRNYEVQLEEAGSNKAADLAVFQISYPPPACLPLGRIMRENISDNVVAVGYAAGHKEDREIGFYSGEISSFVGQQFETTVAIQGPGQSGGPVYHYKSRRVAGLVQGVYDSKVMSNAGLALRFDSLFEEWPELGQINNAVARSWENRLNELIIVSHIQLDELRALFRRIPDIPSDDKLISLCHEVMPRPRKLFELPDCQGDTLFCLLDRLARITGSSPSGHRPILDFTARLLRFKEFEPIRDEIKEWMHSVSQDLNLSRADTDALIDRQTTASTKRAFESAAYLLIMLDKEVKKSDRYRVHAWFFKDDNITPITKGITENVPRAGNSGVQRRSLLNRLSSLFGKSEPEDKNSGSSYPDLRSKTFTLNEMPGLVNDLLNIVYKNFGISRGKLTIEFFLPFNLLSHNMDQWAPETEFECEPFGCRSRIVLRSKERFEDVELSSNLDDYWKDDLLQYNPEKCVTWIEKPDPRGLIDRLEDEKIFFALKFAPELKFIVRLIRLGTPFILWPRQIREPDEPNKLTTLLCTKCQCRLEDVPELVRQERRKIVDGEMDKACITYPVSLLWDDPRRKPPEPGSQKKSLSGIRRERGEPLKRPRNLK